MKKTKQAWPVSDELIDEWLKQGRKPEDVQGLLRQFTKQVVEWAMQGEMAEHLRYENSLQQMVPDAARKIRKLNLRQ